MSSHDLSDASLPSVLAGAAGATGTAMVATAMGAAAKSANGSVKKALTFSASGKVSSVSTDRQNLLARTDDTAWNTSWVTNLQRHTGSISDALQESRAQSLFCGIITSGL